MRIKLYVTLDVDYVPGDSASPARSNLEVEDHILDWFAWIQHPERFKIQGPAGHATYRVSNYKVNIVERKQNAAV